MAGTLMGLVFIEVMTDGMVLRNVSQDKQDMLRGLIILAAVLMTS